MEISIATQAFFDSLVSVDRARAASILNECYSEYRNFSVIEKIIITSLEHIGEKWEEGELSLAQVYMSGNICEELADQYLTQSAAVKINYPVIASAVLLDHHGLGMKIVSSIVKSNGYELLNFGTGAGVDKIVQLSVDNKVDILLISVLMFPSALKVRELCGKLKLSGRNVFVAVGGAPFRLDPELWKIVGADASGGTAADVIEIIKRFKGERNA